MPSTLLFKNVTWNGEMCMAFWEAGSAIWTDPSEGLLAPRRLLKISGMYIFPVLQLSVRLSNLMWMVSLASLASCLLS